MNFKITIWAVLSVFNGCQLNNYLQPIELGYSVVMFVLPLFLFGFQNNFKACERSFEICGFEIFQSKVDFKQLTFWGIPVENEQTVASTFNISDKEGGKKLFPLLKLIPRYLPVIFQKRFSKWFVLSCKN